MKNRLPTAVATLLVAMLGTGGVQLFAADGGTAPAKKTTVGTALRLTNRDVEMAARAWQRIFGETVIIAERAKSRKVSVDISSSKDEFRGAFAAALRENGIHVIQRSGAVLFDTEPAATSEK